MKLNYLLYYIISLIKEGHKWQYQNLNNSGNRPTFWFTGLQILALIAAGVFLFLQPEGILKENVIDYILSSLSILTGIYLSLLVFVYDRYKLIDFKKFTDTHKCIRTWCFYSQLNGLISYSILIAIIVILILISSLLFGTKTDITQYTLVSKVTLHSIIMFLRLAFVVCMRITMVYFLLDFFILGTYIVSSIFHFINNDMEENNPKKKIDNSKTALSILWKQHRMAYLITIVILTFIALLATGYVASMFYSIE